MDGFSELIERANAFHAELAANNNRDWFEPRKDFYKGEIKAPAELLGDVMAEELGRLTGKSFRFKLFRINRDVRFSKDKSPYNAHLHLAWVQEGAAAPDWFFGASPSYLNVLTGVHGLTTAELGALRSAIDADGDGISAALAFAGTNVGATLSDFGAKPLKRIPKPFDQDHPQGALLKRKSLVVSAALEASWKENGLVPALRKTAAGLMPVWTWLDTARD
ncbi:MAG: TIGR02453 family protein [Pseudomonadota bacterium]